MNPTEDSASERTLFREPQFTVEPGDGPVAADAGGEGRQLEDEGPHVGVGVGVRGRDVDPGVGPRPLAHLGLAGHQHGGVVVDVDQVDLQGPGAAGLG